jgi:hypothetical protein
MDFSEKIAKAVVEAVLPAARLNYKERQSDGEYELTFTTQMAALARLRSQVL